MASKATKKTASKTVRKTSAGSAPALIKKTAARNALVTKKAATNIVKNVSETARDLVVSAIDAVETAVGEVAQTGRKAIGSKKSGGRSRQSRSARA